jgi:hypothetical protein
MRVVEVTNEQQANDFLELPVAIYKGDVNWVRPLDDDINKVFSREKRLL